MSELSECQESKEVETKSSEAATGREYMKWRVSAYAGWTKFGREQLAVEMIGCSEWLRHSMPPETLLAPLEASCQRQNDRHASAIHPFASKLVCVSGCASISSYTPLHACLFARWFASDVGQKAFFKITRTCRLFGSRTESSISRWVFTRIHDGTTAHWLSYGTASMADIGPLHVDELHDTAATCFSHCLRSGIRL